MARTIEFNRDDVLHSAMTIFWQKGYSLTSIPNLVSATKLNPGSIYAAFDSKEGLFLETLEFYGSRSLATLQQFISDADSPLIGIRNFFDALINKPQEEIKRGCLLVNTILEMSSHNATIQAQANKQLKAVETELFDALTKAQNLGELTDQADLKSLAKYLMVNIWGLRVMAKTGQLNNKFEARDALVDNIMKTLNT